MRSFSEIAFQTDCGRIAGVEWQAPEGAPVIIALHGWLDNAASFIPLANYLKDFRLIALDLPGHGFSDHKRQADFYTLSDYTRAVSQAITAMGVGPVWLLGHSLGAIVTNLLALTETKISGIICLDAIGGLSREPSDVATSWKDALAAIQNFKPRKPSYPTFDVAVTARENSALPVSLAAAILLCSRGLEHLPDGRWTWRNDKALMLPGPVRWDEKANLDLLAAIEHRVLVIMAESGWMTKMDATVLEQRYAVMQNATIETVPGGHHFHMDAAAENIASIMKNHIARSL